MAAGTSFLRLLVVLLLGFSLVVASNAVPVSRTMNLMDESLGIHQVSGNNNLEKVEGSWEVGRTTGRMNLELNDYPGSGANNRHTPRP